MASRMVSAKDRETQAGHRPCGSPCSFSQKTHGTARDAPFLGPEIPVFQHAAVTDAVRVYVDHHGVHFHAFCRSFPKRFGIDRVHIVGGGAEVLFVDGDVLEEVLGDAYDSCAGYMTDGQIDLTKCPDSFLDKYVGYSPAYLCVLSHSENTETAARLIEGIVSGQQ